MRITFIATKLNLDKGGSNPDLYLKIKTLNKLGHEIKLITVFPEINKLPAPLPCQVFAEAITNKSLFNIQKQIFKILKKYESQTDIFHIEGHFLYGGGLYRQLGGQVPVIAFFNRELVSWPPFSENLLKRNKQQIRYWLEKNIGSRLANYIDFFIFTSPKMEENYFAFGLKKGQSTAMPDFVDIAETNYWAKNNPPRKTAGVYKIFCAGRLVPEKRFDLVIGAVALLKNKYPIELVVGGDGPNLPNLEKTAQDCQVKDMVSFPGWLGRQDIMCNFQECDVCITPQWRPDISSVQLIEAMALKTPCLVPENTTFAWIAGQGAATFRQNDIEDLAKQITRLIEDKNLAGRLGEAGQKRAHDLDCWQLAKQLEETIRRVAKK